MSHHRTIQQLPKVVRTLDGLNREIEIGIGTASLSGLNRPDATNGTLLLLPQGLFMAAVRERLREETHLPPERAPFEPHGIVQRPG
jgi:hypothetical protein